MIIDHVAVYVRIWKGPGLSSRPIFRRSAGRSTTILSPTSAPTSSPFIAGPGWN